MFPRGGGTESFQPHELSGGFAYLAMSKGYVVLAPEYAPRPYESPSSWSTYDLVDTYLGTMNLFLGSPGYLPRYTPQEIPCAIGAGQQRRQAGFSCIPWFLTLTWHIIDKHEMTITGILFRDHRLGT